jgi:hypothetical protein
VKIFRSNCFQVYLFRRKTNPSTEEELNEAIALAILHAGINLAFAKESGVRRKASGVRRRKKQGRIISPQSTVA